METNEGPANSIDSIRAAARDAHQAARAVAVAIGMKSTSKSRFVVVAIPSHSVDGFRFPTGAKPHIVKRSASQAVAAAAARKHAVAVIVDREAS